MSETNRPAAQTVTLTIDQSLKEAIAHHRAGRLQDAERLYRAIIQAKPCHSDANHNLGVLAVQVNQATAGLTHFKTALESNPDQSQYWLSYVDALIRADKIDAARQLLAKGIQRGLRGDTVNTLMARLEKLSSPPQHEVDLVISSFQGCRPEAEALAFSLTERFPSFAPGWQILCSIIKRSGRNDDALRPMLNAVALAPNDPVVLSSLGALLHDLGQFDQSLANCRKAIEVRPDYATAHSNLGNALTALGQVADAEASYRRAIAIKPNFAQAHGNLGNVLQVVCRREEAEASFRRALQINPDLAEVHANLGNVLQDLGRLDDAEFSYRRALEVDPRLAAAYAGLGHTQQDQGRLDEAEASYRRALKIKPDDAATHFGLGYLQNEFGKMDAAATHFRSCLEIDPDDSLGARLLLASLGHETLPDRASDAQLKRLYKSKAHYWDRGKWPEGVAYFGHELVANALMKLPRTKSKLDILDAGCGTGLVGELVRGISNRLDGIDMSSDMIEKAREKGIYDKIYQGDLVDFMAKIRCNMT